MATSQSIKGTFFERFWSRVQRADGDACWLWTAARFPAGYGKVALPKTRKLDGAHRIAWLLTHGPIPGGLWVLHTCDNPPCCRPDHLFLGTVKRNAVDMVQKNRHARQTYRRFSADDVVAIRARSSAGESNPSIARSMKCDRSLIRKIVRKVTYTDVA